MIVRWNIMAVYDLNGNKIFPEKSIFQGVKMVCFGDSLTEENFQYTKGWHRWLKEILDLISYVNEGQSGATSATVLSQINNYTANGESIVTIMHGSNDTGIDDATERNNIESISQTVKAKFPQAIVIYITPHYQTKYQTGINTTLQIRQDILDIAPKYSISVYDNYQFMGLYSGNLNILTNDGCHWNDKGHEIVGKNLAEWILVHFKHLL